MTGGPPPHPAASRPPSPEGEGSPAPFPATFPGAGKAQRDLQGTDPSPSGEGGHAAAGWGRWRSSGRGSIEVDSHRNICCRWVAFARRGRVRSVARGGEGRCPRGSATHRIRRGEPARLGALAGRPHRAREAGPALTGGPSDPPTSVSARRSGARPPPAPPLALPSARAASAWAPSGRLQGSRHLARSSRREPGWRTILGQQHHPRTPAPSLKAWGPACAGVSGSGCHPHSGAARPPSPK